MRSGLKRLWMSHRGQPLQGYALALGALLVLTATEARAQPVERSSAKPEPAAATPAPDVQGASEFGNNLVAPNGSLPPMASLVTSEPEGWELYFKGGAVWPLGDGFFEKHLGVGWTAQFGMRQPLYRSPSPWMLFAEFGGGYTANTGLSNRPVTTSGIAFFPNDDHIHQANDFYDTQIVELQRGFVQGALGAYYYPGRFNRPGERLFHVNARLGVRGGGMKAVYHDEVQAGLLRVWEAHAGPEGHGHDPLLAQYFPDRKDPELFFGLFGSVGAGLTYYDARIFGRRFCDITLSAEVEFAHEWFDAGAYGHTDNGLGSFTPMLSVAFSF
jgi:hypothetical protein